MLVVLVRKPEKVLDTDQLLQTEANFLVAALQAFTQRNSHEDFRLGSFFFDA
jgi:hypothetical protein